MASGRIKRPAYQWYPSEANDDEVFCLMTYEQQGIYRALLDRQWLEGSIPADVALLAALCPKIPAEKFQAVWTLISSKFQPCGEGRLINAKLKAQEQELNEWIATQHTKAAAGGRKKAQNMAAAKSRIVANGLANARTGLVAEGVAGALPKPTSGSLSLSVPKTKEQSSGAAEKAPSPAKEFLTWFQGEYKARRHGATYFVTWDKHMPIVGRLLKLHDPQRLRKHAHILLTTNEPWTETTDRGIEVLAGKINWLEERLCAWEVKRKAREAV